MREVVRARSHGALWPNGKEFGFGSESKWRVWARELQSFLLRKILLDTGGTEWRRRGHEVEAGVPGTVSEGGDDGGGSTRGGGEKG